MTGAAGFIGQHVVRRLLCDGVQVVGLDRRPWSDAPCAALVADIRDADALRDAFDQVRPRAVIHLASLVGVRSSVEDPSGYRETNVEGTANVVEAAAACGAERIVFSSSSSVYGARTPRASEETDALEPRSPYAATKVEAEAIVRRFAGRSTIARLFTVYGPGMRPDLALHRFVAAIEGGHPITMFGDGRSERDYTHVSDIAEGLVASLSRSGPEHLTCNLGSGHSVTLAVVIETLSACLGRPAVVIEAAPHPADAPHTRASLRAAALHLGYQPRVGFERGVRELVRALTVCGQDASRSG